ARTVSDEDVRDIAAYFASQPHMKGKGGDAHTVGRRLYEQGDAARGVLACVQCHGAQGKGVAGLPLVPVIGGQEWRYLDQQLRDWRSGERRNSADGVMNQVLKPLTDAEVESLALYLSGL
ncbi:MAG: c-type cytochrome, partial [Aquabacterium sp.]